MNLNIDLNALEPFVKFETGSDVTPLSTSDFKLLMRDKKKALLDEDDVQLLLSTNPEVAAQVGAAFEALLENSRANNVKRHQLAAYQKATARLAEYPLSDGRAAYSQGSGRFEVDEDSGEPTEIMIEVDAVPPLVAEEVEYPVIDEVTGEQTGTVSEQDREVVARLEKDAAERAEAQAVIDATPQEVKDWQEENG